MAGFELTAALTAAQCDELASLLADDLPACGATDVIEVAAPLLGPSASNCPKRVRTIVSDFQWDDMFERQVTRITAAARHYRMLEIVRPSYLVGFRDPICSCPIDRPRYRAN